MGITTLPVGLQKQTAGDPNWNVGLDAGFDLANTRLTLNGAGDPNGVVAGFWIGQPYFQTSTNKMWHCATATGDVNSVWVTLDNISSLSLAALSVASAIQMNGGAALPAGQKLLVPAGESWINNGLALMNAHAHASRHRSLLAATADELDFIPLLLQNLYATQIGLGTDSITNASISDDATNVLTQIVDCSNRRAGSTVLVCGLICAFCEAGASLEATLVRDAEAPTAETFKSVGMTFNNRFSLVVAEKFEGLSAASHTFKLRARVTFVTPSTRTNAQLFCFDYGLS